MSSEAIYGEERGTKKQLKYQGDDICVKIT